MNNVKNLDLPDSLPVSAGTAVKLATTISFHPLEYAKVLIQVWLVPELPELGIWGFVGL